MRKSSPKRKSATWFKIHELGSSDDELDVAYAEIIATAMDFRIKRGITQADLSRKSGLSSSMISKIESQHSVPTLKNFLKYIRGLGLDWEFVYRSRDEKKRPL